MNRALVFCDVLDRYSVEGLLQQLRRPSSPRRVIIDSPGGEFSFFSTLGPAIERQGITTLAADVQSAAVILFLLGHRRLASPDSTFFFHEVRTLVQPGGAITIADLELVNDYASELASRKDQEVYQQWLQNMKSAQVWFLDYIARRTGVPTGTFLNLMRSEATLSGPEAKRYGIVHEIISPEVISL